ncbi:MAG: DUF433 domain-containing protein [Chloroflexi bacterium]|nr:DUF433 domain-containing protein [Chloroflexota bacterium]
MARKTQPYSLRLDPATVRRLNEEAGRRAVAPRTLAQDLVEEGLRMRRHPIIRFVDRASGRRACLIGRRLTVTDVVEWVRGSSDLDAVSLHLDLSRAEIDQVLAYYTEFKDEVDAEVERLHDDAEREHRLWRERQQLIKR